MSQWHSNRRVDYLDRAALCPTRRMEKSWRYASHQKYLHGWSVLCRKIFMLVEGVRLDAVTSFEETANVQAFHDEADSFRTICTFRKSSSFIESSFKMDYALHIVNHWWKEGIFYVPSRLAPSRAFGPPVSVSQDVKTVTLSQLWIRTRTKYLLLVATGSCATLGESTGESTGMPV